MSHEALIQDRMRKLGNITADFLAHLIGIPGTRLSQAFRGIRSLDNNQVTLISDTLKELEDLANECDPLPLSFVSPKLIREVLHKKRNGELLIDVRVVSGS